MTPATTLDVERHHRAVPVRASVYGLLADLLSFPTPALSRAMASGELADRVPGLLEGLPYAIDTDLSDLGCGATPQEIESEFIRLFDAPVDGVPVPLYGGLYHGDRTAVMEELLRFYRHFGLTTANATTLDLPDALPTVLEFLSFLVRREGEQPSAAAAASHRRAQRDLLERHLATWMPKVDRRLILKEPMPCYRAVVRLTSEVVAAELASLS